MAAGLDWTHGNALVYLADDDAFLLSMRNQHWIVKVDRASGDVAWRMGAGGDFTLREGDTWFYGQHAPELQADGTLLVYDNGKERPGGVTESRVVRVAFDEEALTARIEWQAPMGVFTPQLGSTNHLAGGTVLSCAGDWTDADAPDVRHSTLVEVTDEPTPRPVREIEVEGLVYRATNLPGFWRPR
jgi:hypothetical protein